MTADSRSGHGEKRDRFAEKNEAEKNGRRRKTGQVRYWQDTLLCPCYTSSVVGRCPDSSAEHSEAWHNGLPSLSISNLSRLVWFGLVCAALCGLAGLSQQRLIHGQGQTRPRLTIGFGRTVQ